jgi:hypothetical protein
MATRTAKLVLAATVAVVVGMLFLQPVITSVNDNTGTQAVTNETVTAQYDEYVELGGYNIDSGSETVWGYNDTAGSYEQAVSGTDYEINYDGGELKVLNGSTLIDDAEDVKVSYDYQASGQTTSLVAGFVPVMIVLLLFVSVAMQVTDIL